MLARGMAGWHVTQTPFDLICVGGGDTLYACNSRGVMHVSYHDPPSPREVLAKAIQDICAGHADKALVDAMAGAAGGAPGADEGIDVRPAGGGTYCQQNTGSARRVCGNRCRLTRGRFYETPSIG